MISMKRKNNVAIVCEGDTEYNYFTGFKGKCESILNIRCVPSDTGNYSTVLDVLKKVSPYEVVARFVLIDFDRYLTIEGEKPNFVKLLNYCNNENKKGNSTFLIVSSPDFDHFVLAHKTDFKWKNKSDFVKKCNYKGLADFKNDTKIFNKFNPNGDEYKETIKKLNRNYPIKNEIVFTKKYTFINPKVLFNEENVDIKTTNVEDLFDIL